ncbi:MAG TPA: hypothetical protein VM100_09540, partial [Longimicrobiales bacterium]|nr:hypothetical protein [Longimicrobiales bacterium]
WPVEGTTGYDFAGALTALFCEPAGLAALADDYSDRTGMPAFDEIVYEKKKFVIENLFPGELVALTRELERIAKVLNVPVGDTALRHCIAELSAALEVYRTYIRSDEIDERDRAAISRALASADKRAPRVLDEGLKLLERVLLNDDIPIHAERMRLDFIAHWQQFTGPATAKGVEDTAFYTHHSLLAVNEVGGHPPRVDTTIDSFHRWMSKRSGAWPHTLNASSTHDTKRSEDVRARIQVLSELSEEWIRALDGWIKPKGPPSVNEQILVYQTLIGVWPLAEHERASLPERMHAFLQKAAREAKHHSSWLEPDEEYEKQLYAFADALLANSAFLAEFEKLQQNTAWLGALNSLSQLVIKLGAPGVPDIYQGNEAWNYSLVDPDNRRPVDFLALSKLLASLPEMPGAAGVTDMLANWQDGRIKLHVTRTGLRTRREKRELFNRGVYLPVKAHGTFADNVIAFMRRDANEWALIVAGRYYTKLGEGVVGDAWVDSALSLPEGAPADWLNVLTGEHVGSTRVSDIFRTAPFAILLPA